MTKQMLTLSKLINKYWYLLLGGLLLYLITRKKAISSEDVKKMSLDEKKAYQVSSDISFKLGTNKSLAWYNPSSWYESDNEVYLIVLENVENFSLMEYFYKNEHTKNRSLLADLESFLPVNYFNEIFQLVAFNNP